MKSLFLTTNFREIPNQYSCTIWEKYAGCMLRVKRWLFLGWGAAACFLYVNSTWGPFLYSFHPLCGDFGPHTKKIKVYGNCKKRTSCGILNTERKQQHPNPKTFKVWPSACSLHTFPHYAYLKKPDLTNSKMNLLCVRIFWKLVLPPPPLLLLHDCDGTRTTRYTFFVKSQHS